MRIPFPFAPFSMVFRTATAGAIVAVTAFSANSFAAISYSESASATAYTTDSSFVPAAVYYPDLSRDGGPQGAALAGEANLAQPAAAVTFSATPPAGASISASPAQYATNVGIGLQSGTLLFHFTADAHSQASVNFGGNSIHATAQATGILGPVSYTYLDDDDNAQIYYNLLIAKSVASAVGSISDTVTVKSSTLAFGTAVDIQVTGTLHSSVTDPEAALAAQFYSPSVYPTPDYTEAHATFVAGNVSLFMRDGDGVVFPHANGSVTSVLHTTVGASFNVVESLTANATGIAFHNTLGGVDVYDNEALAGNTTFLNLNPLTASVTLSSEGGIDYTAVPTPEPASAAFLCIACVSLLTRRRKARNGA